MTFTWGWITGGEGRRDWCTYYEAHGQTVLEFVSFDETSPDLVDTAVPDGIAVRIGVVEKTLETEMGWVYASWLRGSVRGREPAGTTGGVVIGTRWGQWISHIEQDIRTGWTQ